ncbi:actin binding protein family [Raphanus sativus]|uniref:Protein CHUP1, chloroplastic-like n=1 Tax=Raphanus sativus TaxID=3726 RepID=A0A9W3CUI6_RAPSA|nr:protein CHUP1, chloroplastic-like [Raphanus sativus]XP_056855100.1 protein CHUP1, chloroplastic-like [Raphanus sativus]KAJ4869246.1 actin binding protein family [Raphanus sativus]
MMIITKHKRDINLFVLQLGAAFAVTFAGFLFSRFRKNTKRVTRPTLPPLRPQSSSDHGYRDTSNEEPIHRGDSRSEYDLDEKDVFLLPEFEDEVKKLDLLVHDDECETPKSDMSAAPLAFPSAEEGDHVNEIKRLRNTVRALRERERCLEDKLLEYYSLKEQQKIAMELRSRLKLNQMETKVFNLKIKSLQAENEKLKAQCSEHSRAVLELDMAKSEVHVLKKKLNIKTQQHVEQLLSLKERVARLQEDEIKASLPVPDADKMVQRLRDLEGEINELRDSNTRLHFENFELAEKVEAVQIIAGSKLEDSEEMETLREDGNRLMSENEELKKEIEQLQGDRCTDLEQLVYLKWINACLRYELRTYQPPAGKTVARDLSTTLSPTSEEKAKQLILEYAHEEDHTDYDQWSSSQESMITDSMFLDDSSVDTLFATNTKKSGKKKLMHKLMKILHGKDTKKRGGSSEPSSSSTGPRRPHSMDFQMLLRREDEEEDFKDHMKMLHRKSEGADASNYGEEEGLESDQNRKKELIKYAEALRKSRSTKKLHKKSVSFFF